jgi:hypothetical protein
MFVFPESSSALEEEKNRLQKLKEEVSFLASPSTLDIYILPIHIIHIGETSNSGVCSSPGKVASNQMRDTLGSDQLDTIKKFQGSLNFSADVLLQYI